MMRETPISDLLSGTSESATEPLQRQLVREASRKRLAAHAQVIADAVLRPSIAVHTDPAKNEVRNTAQRICQWLAKRIALLESSLKGDEQIQIRIGGGAALKLVDLDWIDAELICITCAAPDGRVHDSISHVSQLSLTLEVTQVSDAPKRFGHALVEKFQR